MNASWDDESKKWVVINVGINSSTIRLTPTQAIKLYEMLSEHIEHIKDTNRSNEQKEEK